LPAEWKGRIARSGAALAVAVACLMAGAGPALARGGRSEEPRRPWTGEITHVTDGDTVWVRPEAGSPPRKLRLNGIDAPEICQAHGEDAREALRRRALHRKVTVTTHATDDYHRLIVTLRTDGDDLGAWMVRQGHAWSYRYRRDPGPYAAEEAQARAGRRGLFADPGAERPRDFRQRYGTCYPNGGGKGKSW